MVSFAPGRYTPKIFHLVVNVCNVHDKVKLEAKVMDQDAPNNICRHIVARVSQMALVVHSRTAGVPGHLSFLDWNKRHRRAGLQRVMKLERLHGRERVSSIDVAFCGAAELESRSRSGDRTEEIHSEWPRSGFKRCARHTRASPT